MAYVINEKLVTTDWKVLNGKARYYQHFLCIKNPPAGVSGWLVAGDIGQAMKTVGPISSVAGINFISTAVSGGDRNGWEVMACDPAKHPVIVDYNTGKIESVNPEALKAINVYELPSD
ncbi:hypothetical protein [Chromobacterium haemolyticum]|uniref:hypothetical protein n=1 Tax=Chromobacterium TaxID=535 RepID=UPI004056AFC5